MGSSFHLQSYPPDDGQLGRNIQCKVNNKKRHRAFEVLGLKLEYTVQQDAAIQYLPLFGFLEKIK
jgi:hypothetical protein